MISENQVSSNQAKPAKSGAPYLQKLVTQFKRSQQTHQKNSATNTNNVPSNAHSSRRIMSRETLTETEGDTGGPQLNYNDKRNTLKVDDRSTDTNRDHMQPSNLSHLS